LGAPERDYIRVSVSDTGSGMGEERLKKIFQPFYTTIEDAVGLGLATVRGIVRKHEGILTAATQLNTGSIFSVYLPAVSK